MMCWRCDSTKLLCNTCGESSAACGCGTEDYYPCTDCQPQVLEKPTLKEVEKAIKITAQKWAGRCHEISALILKKELVKGELRYGHWLGPVDIRSPFYLTSHSMGFVQHGWIEDRGDIIDPTRWVFESRAPYIYHGPCKGWYDVGGNQHRKKLRQPCAPFKKSDPQVAPPKGKLAAVIGKILGARRMMSVKQAHWIANLSPDELEPNAKEIYEYLIDAGCVGLIPVDNKNLIMGVKL